MFIPFHDNNPIRRWPLITVIIIVTNVVCYFFVLGSTQGNPRQQATLLAKYGFVPKRINQLFDDQVVVEVNLVPEAQRLRQEGLEVPADIDEKIKLAPVQGEILLSLLTTMFLHANIPHLLGNMWFFWIFGNNVEDRLGHLLFLGFYLLGGVVASVCHWAMTPEVAATIPVIGASGAVAAMLGAYAVTYPKARVKVLMFIVVFITVIELPALIVLGFWLLVQVLEGLDAMQLGINGGVAWWAHIGGFILGAAVMPIFLALIPEAGDDWDEILHNGLDH